MSAAWKRCLALTIAIFSLAPMGRTIQLWARDQFGENTILWVFLVAAVAGGLALTRKLARANLGKRHRIVLAVCLLWFLGLAWTLRDNPEEVFHLWEYGFLTYLFWCAFSEKSGPDAATALSAALLTACVGAGDELIQWVLPSRYFDFRDIGINSAAGSLTAAALCIASGTLGSSIRVSSFRGVRYASGLTLLIAMFISLLTPPRIQRLGEIIPALSFLANEHVVDFGYMNEIEGGIRFRSHFRGSELAAIDEKRGGDVDQLLAVENRGSRDEFLARYSDVSDPFVNEAEVHLFRRNVYFEQWGKSHEQKSAQTVLGEQAILDRFFPESTAHETLSGSDRKKLVQTAGFQEPYESPVQGSLITEISKGQLMLVFVGMVGGWLWLRPRKVAD